MERQQGSIVSRIGAVKVPEGTKFQVSYGIRQVYRRFRQLGVVHLFRAFRRKAVFRKEGDNLLHGFSVIVNADIGKAVEA